MMKITYFDVLRGPFVDLDQASGRVPKILQNYAKMQIKSSQNEHEKYIPPSCNGQKRTPTLALRKYMKLYSIVSFPVLIPHVMNAKIAENRRKFIIN